MSLERGMLGFLAMKPLSGYDLKKLFDMSAAYFWPADQNQIYRTLKKLEENGLLTMEGSEKGRTVNKKVYAITDQGREALLEGLETNSIEDFISRDAFLLQLFFSGALSEEEQMKFIDLQLDHVKQLQQELIENYNLNLARFMNMTGLDKEDRRIESAVYAHRWGLIKCREYGKLLEEIRGEMVQKREQ